MQESDREWPGALLARRTRTIRPYSFNARSRGQPWPLPPIRFCSGGVKEKKGKKGGLAIPYARATRGLRRPSLDARTTGKRQTSPSDPRGLMVPYLHCAPDIMYSHSAGCRGEGRKTGTPMKKVVKWPSVSCGGRLPVCRRERLLPVDIHAQNTACMSKQRTLHESKAYHFSLDLLKSLPYNLYNSYI